MIIVMTLRLIKAVSSFGILKHIHRSSTIARVVVKVLINKEDDTPDDIVVSPGDSPKAPSWTVPVYILHAQDLLVYGDEEPLPPFGPVHPIPHPIPRWVGVEGELSQVHGPAGALRDDASVGNAPMVQDPPARVHGPPPVVVPVPDVVPAVVQEVQRTPAAVPVPNVTPMVDQGVQRTPDPALEPVVENVVMGSC